MLANSDRDTLDQFEVEIGQLEICNELILSNSPLKSRDAVILLDHFADTVMYRKCLEVFSRDAYFKFVLPEKFSAVQRRDILKFFEEKLTCVQERLALISELDAVILRIGHDYRNAIYHRDTHNPRTINAIARSLFEAAGNAYVALGDTVSVGGVHEDATKWLAKYGYQTGMVDILALRLKIVTELTSNVKISFADLKNALSQEVEERAKAIANLLHKDLPIKNDRMIDELLLEKEFHERHAIVVDKISEPFRQMRYRIQTNNPPSREEHDAAEEAFHKNLDAEMKTFTPSISSTVVKDFVSYKDTLQASTELSDLLSKYHQQDTFLSRTERYLDEIYSDFETAVQMEIDIARGK